MIAWGLIGPPGDEGPGPVFAVLLVACGLAAVEFHRQGDWFQVVGALLGAALLIGVWIALAIASRRERKGGR